MRSWQPEEYVAVRALQKVDDGQSVRVAGLLVVRQAPRTAKGVVFLTLEDETGFINVILYPQVYEQYRVVVRKHVFLLVKGTVQHQHSVVNVIADTIHPLNTSAGH